MRRRVAELVGPVTSAMWVSTFHSACVRILRAHADLLGYPRQFSIYDQADATRLDRLRDPRPRARPKRFTPRGVHGVDQHVEERARRSGAGRGAGPAHLRPQARRGVRRVPEAAAVAAGAMDFDDLLVNTVELFREHPDVLEAYRQRFEHILVDEYQDTNAPRTRSCCCSPAATATSPSSATPTSRSTASAAPTSATSCSSRTRSTTGVTTVVLDQNYRSTQTILDAANAVIANNAERKPKNLWTDAGRGDRIVRFWAEDEGDEARFVAAHRPRPAQHRRHQLARDGGALPHQRPEPGRRGSVDAPRRAVQGGRRHALLRPPRDPRRDGVPAGGRQPRRRGQRQADPQRAQAGHRRHERRQARPVRRRDGDGVRRRRCATPTRPA